MIEYSCSTDRCYDYLNVLRLNSIRFEYVMMTEVILSIIQTCQLHLLVEGDGVGEGLVFVFCGDNGGGEFLSGGFVSGSHHCDVVDSFKLTAPFNGCVDLNKNIVGYGGVHLFGEDSSESL